MNILPILAAGLSIFVMANSAGASSYSGNRQLTKTDAHGSQTYCLTLNDNGSIVYPHSGQGSLTGPGIQGSPYFATFQVIEQSIMVTVEVPGGNGQNSGWVIVAHASLGSIGKGVFEDVGAGEEFDSGTVVFGAKGGC